MVLLFLSMSVTALDIRQNAKTTAISLDVLLSEYSLLRPLEENVPQEFIRL